MLTRIGYFSEKNKYFGLNILYYVLRVKNLNEHFSFLDFAIAGQQMSYIEGEMRNMIQQKLDIT